MSKLDPGHVCDEVSEAFVRGVDLSQENGVITVLHVRAPSGKVQHMICAIDDKNKKIVPIGIALSREDLKKYIPLFEQADADSLFKQAAKQRQEIENGHT